MEEELSKHLKELAEQSYGLSPGRCRSLAFEYAEKNHVPMPSSWRERQCAGKTACDFLMVAKADLPTRLKLIILGCL